jgi:hypothetical protein
VPQPHRVADPEAERAPAVGPAQLHVGAVVHQDGLPSGPADVRKDDVGRRIGAEGDLALFRPVLPARTPGCDAKDDHGWL